jgi:serine/threonine protein kinase
VRNPHRLRELALNDGGAEEALKPRASHKPETESVHTATLDIAPDTILLDKFKVIRILGRGGMGSVYQVRHLHLGTEFAFKCLNKRHQNDSVWRRFQVEARAAHKLDHRNLIKVHDSGIMPDGQPYLIMDYVDGVTLGDEIARLGRLPIARVLKVFFQVASALEYAHENGVIHRDIKPSNIMLVNDGSKLVVKVVDFGIAKLTGIDEFNQQTLTRTGEIFGSPLYMSPEQCLGTTIDLRSDLYSTGCMMYEALTGAPPIMGDSALATMMKHQSEKPLSLKQASLGLDFPPQLDAIVAKLLEKDPQMRYSNAESFKADLVSLERALNSAAVSPVIIAAPVLDKSLSKKTSQIGSISLPRVAAIVALATSLSLISGIAIGYFVHAPNQSSHHDPTVTNPQTALTAKTEAAAPEPTAITPLPLTAPVMKKGTPALAPSRSYSKDTADGNRVFQFPTDPRFSPGKIKFRTHNGDQLEQWAHGEVIVSPAQPIDLIVGTDIISNPSRLLLFKPGEICSIELDDCDENLHEIIKQLPRLACPQIRADHTPLDDDDLVILDQIPNLESLYVRGTKVTADKLAKMKILPGLKAFAIGELENPQPVLARFKDMPHLSTLHMANCTLTENDLEKLGKATTLTWLQLIAIKGLDDNTLNHLRGLTNLRNLDIRHSNVSPKCITVLKDLPQLRLVTVSGWSAADRDAVGRELPQAKIELRR